MNSKQIEKQSFPLRFIIKVVEPFKSLVIMFFFTLIISSFLEIFGLAMFLPLFEIILGKESGSQLSKSVTYPMTMIGIESSIINISIMLLIIIFVKVLFRLFNTYFSNKLCFKIRELMMVEINDYYLSTPYEEIVKQKQGVLINNSFNEPNKASGGIMKISEFLVSLFMIVFYYVLLITTNLMATFILTIVSIFIYLVFSKLSKKYSIRFGEQEMVFNQKINAIAAESISALRQVKTFGINNIINEKLSKNVKGLSIVGIKNVLFQALPRSIIEVLLFTGIVFTIIMLYNISLELLMSVVPILTLFVIVSQRLLGFLVNLVSNRSSLNYYLPSIVLVQSLLEKNRLAKVELRKSNLVEVKSLDTNIVFDNVTFSYNGAEPVFSNLSFSISKGETTAIIGDSGSGKSTIADLILALYLPSSGKISFNGSTINDINIVDWRKNIGFVSQDNFLFHNTIMENIKFGNLAASDEMVINAAKQANAHDFISRFPEGYETVVGDRGMLVSGGQKQRIAIARALVRDPEILIFDEATSALDYKTEKELQQEIFNIAKGKTVLIISHRLETVKNANNIMKIENGKIFKVNYHDIL